MLLLRQIIPPLTLHLADGRTIRAWDFKQKKNLVIAFLHDDCPPCEDFLHNLSAAAPLWKENDTVVLAAFLSQPSHAITDALDASVILGVDRNGQSTAAYLGKDALSPSRVSSPAIFQTDRYGELAAQWQITRDHNFPPISEIATQAALSEMSCDSCAAPSWPTE